MYKIEWLDHSDTRDRYEQIDFVDVHVRKWDSSLLWRVIFHLPLENKNKSPMLILFNEVIILKKYAFQIFDIVSTIFRIRCTV